MEYLILQSEEKHLTIAHFGLSRRSTELIGTAVIELNDELSLTDALKSVACKMKGSPTVILALPPYMFAQRSVTLPFDDLRKAREVLASQLQGDIAIPIEELTIQVLPIGDGQFLALWARTTEIHNAIKEFTEAGIEPQIVTSIPFALTEMPGISADCALCDGNMLALLKAGRLTYFRASNHLLTSSNIDTTLSALELSGNELPPYLYLIGREVSEFLNSETLSIPTKPLEVPPELGHLFKNDQTFVQLATLYAVAKSAYLGTLPNFRQGELAWKVGDAKLRKKLILTGILTVILLLLLFANKGLQYRSAQTDLYSLNKSISSLYREVFPTRAKAVDEISEIKGEIKKLSGVQSTVGYIDILKKLADAKGASINGLYEAELEGANLRIKGDARSAQAVNEFKTSISPILDSSELGEVKSRPDGTVSFSLTGVVKEVGK